MCRASKYKKIVTWKNYKQHRREKLHIMLLKKEVVNIRPVLCIVKLYILLLLLDYEVVIILDVI